MYEWVRAWEGEKEEDNGKLKFKVVLLFVPLANLSTQEVRQLYFEMKEKVFGKARLGYGCDTEAQEALLKRVFGESKMVELENGPKYE